MRFSVLDSNSVRAYDTHITILHSPCGAGGGGRGMINEVYPDRAKTAIPCHSKIEELFAADWRFDSTSGEDTYNQSEASSHSST